MISRYFSRLMPGTFSARKNFGRASATMRKKSTNSALRPSCLSPLPIELKPWQGGLPIIPSTSFRPRRRFSARPVSSAMSAPMWAVPGKLRRCDPSALASTSTAPRTANPARAAPKLSPPTPQNRSTTSANAALRRRSYKNLDLGRPPMERRGRHLQRRAARAPPEPRAACGLRHPGRPPPRAPIFRPPESPSPPDPP